MTDSLTATSEVKSEVTAATLAAFSDAFNRHDANALMGFMTEDCVFDAAGGNDIHGTRFKGRAAVRAAFETVFKTFPDAHWGHGRHYVAGGRGYRNGSLPARMRRAGGLRPKAAISSSSATA